MTEQQIVGWLIVAVLTGLLVAQVADIVAIMRDRARRKAR